MIEFWLRYNWHWLSSAVIFSAGVLGIAILTGFECKWAYDTLMLLFLLAAMAIMVNFLWRMRAGKYPLLENPHELPRPSFIMMVVFTVGGIFGYLYITVLKFSLYLNDCFLVVEKFEKDEMKVLLDILDEGRIVWLKFLVRICLCFFLAISCVYLTQRSKVDASGRREQILANVLNFFFAVFFFKAVCNEAYLLIEDYCYKSADKGFMDLFCSNHTIPNDKFSSGKIIYCFNKTYNETKINAEQRSWVNVYSRLLRDVTLSIFTELMPILLVCHLLSNGSALKIVRKETMKSMKNNKYVINIWIGAENDENCENIYPAPKAMPEFNFAWLLKALSFIIPIISIITWNGSFFRSLIHDVEDEHDTIATNIEEIDMQIHLANLSLLLITRIFAMLLFVGMVVNWTRKIPLELIDLERKATTGADKCLMVGGLIFLGISKIFYLGQFVLLFFNTNEHNSNIDIRDFGEHLNNSPNYESTLTTNILQILYKLTTIVCQILSTIALNKIAAISTEHLKQFKQVLPILSICGMFFNANCFFQIYFFMDRSKQWSRLIGPNVWNSIVFLLYQAECLTKIGGYLYNMTSALSWFDIVIQYIEMDHFNLAKVF